MRSEEFIRELEDWCAQGGRFPERIPHTHVIAAPAEAEAVCRALATGDLYAPNSIKTPALYDLAALFQRVGSEAAIDVFVDRGLPLLRRILDEALRDASAEIDDDLSRKADTHVFLLKILAMYGQPGDGTFVVRAARNPRMAMQGLWHVVFEILEKVHPDATEVWDALRRPLPEDSVSVAYLDIANQIATKQPGWNHPFDSDLGIARLFAYLADRDTDDRIPGLCAVRGIQFVDTAAREKLIACADQHSDWLVRLEAAIALARTGSDFGWQRLAQLCLNPRFALRATEALRELGLEAHIPPKASNPDFEAMAEMCEWLMDPMEFDRAPDEIALYDTRELSWPPTKDRRRLWLFKYRFEPKGDRADVKEGIGMVGSTTFALFGEATADLSPEDVYGLHCCWELELQRDSAAKRSAAAGRKILAEANPGFPAA